MTALRRWAPDNDLKPSETDYVARYRDRRRLRFGVGGDAAIEQAYRTHWVSPDLSKRTIERQSKPPDLVVIIPVNEWTCALCGSTGDFLFMEDPGPLCLDCADLGCTGVGWFGGRSGVPGCAGGRGYSRGCGRHGGSEALRHCEGMPSALPVEFTAGP